nr:MAG TPA: hypothetical protein [Caudoviricetes sp.]DAM27163.1 MAG TPA: hypothetical protein [Caudoviricetes sp.]
MLGCDSAIIYIAVSIFSAICSELDIVNLTPFSLYSIIS